jgi:hypothetical protein
VTRRFRQPTKGVPWPSELCSCDVCGSPTQQTVTFRFSRRSLAQDLCATHLQENSCAPRVPQARSQTHYDVAVRTDGRGYWPAPPRPHPVQRLSEAGDVQASAEANHGFRHARETPRCTREGAQGSCKQARCGEEDRMSKDGSEACRVIQSVSLPGLLPFASLSAAPVDSSVARTPQHRETTGRADFGRIAQLSLRFDQSDMRDPKHRRR